MGDVHIHGDTAQPSRAAAVRMDIVRPFSTGRVYVNFLGDEGADRVRAAYGAAKYARLEALMNAYDPANMFRLNQNIAPTV